MTTKVAGSRGVEFHLKSNTSRPHVLIIQVLSNLLPPMSKKRRYGYVFHLCVLFTLGCYYIENHSCSCLFYVILKSFCFKHFSLNYGFGGREQINQWIQVMLKILQARLQQYMSHELPYVQAGFRKGRGTRDQTANSHRIIRKARKFQKKIYFCFIDYAKAFDCADHNKLWNILKEMGIPDDLTCLLRNLYAGQEATVRTGHGTTDRFQIGKGVLQGCILSPCLFNLYAEYIMRDAGLEKHKLESRFPGEKSITSDM